MFTADASTGVVTITPPAFVAGEVVARVYGFTINEWFYLVAIVCMVISTLTTSIVAFIKARRKEG